MDKRIYDILAEIEAEEKITENLTKKNFRKDTPN